MDIAELGISVNTASLTAGTAALKTFRDAALEAAAAADKLDASTARIIAAAAGTGGAMTQLKGQFEAQNVTIANLSAQVDALTGANKAYASTISDLQSGLAAYQNRLADAEQRVQTLTVGLMKSSTELNNHRKAIAEASDALPTLAAEIANTTATVLKLGSDLTSNITPSLERFAEKVVAAGSNSQIAGKLMSDAFKTAGVDAAIASQIMEEFLPHIDMLKASGVQAAAGLEETGKSAANAGNSLKGAASAIAAAGIAMDDTNVAVKESVRDYESANRIVATAIKNNTDLTTSRINEKNAVADVVAVYKRLTPAIGELDAAAQKLATAFGAGSLASQQAILNVLTGKVKTLDDATAAYEARLAKSLSTTDSVTAAVARHQKEINFLTTALGTNYDSEGKVTEGIARHTAEIKRLEEGIGHTTGTMMNSIQATESARVVTDLLTGRIQAAERSGFALANQFQLLNGIFSTTGLAVAAFIAPVALVVGSMISAANANVDLSKALQVTGSTSGLTTTQVKALADQATQTSIKTVAANEELTVSLIKTGAVGGEAIQELVKHGSDLESFFGDDKALIKFAESLRTPEEAAKELQTRIAGITYEWVKHIQTLDQAGLREEAQVEVINKITQAAQGQGDKVTLVGQIWEALYHTVSNVGHFVEVLDAADANGLFKSFGNENDFIKAVNEGLAQQEASQKKVNQLVLDYANAFNELYDKIKPVDDQSTQINTKIADFTLLLSKGAIDLDKYGVVVGALTQRYRELNDSVGLAMDKLDLQTKAVGGKSGADLAVAQAQLQAQTNLPGQQVLPNGQFALQLIDVDKARVATSVLASLQAQTKAYSDQLQAQLPLQDKIAAAQGASQAAMVKAQATLQIFTIAWQAFGSEQAKQILTSTNLLETLAKIDPVLKTLYESLLHVGDDQVQGQINQINRGLVQQGQILDEVAKVAQNQQERVRTYWTTYFQLLNAGAAPEKARIEATLAQNNADKEFNIQSTNKINLLRQQVDAGLAEANATGVNKAGQLLEAAARQANLDVMNHTIDAKDRLADQALLEMKAGDDLDKGLADLNVQLDTQAKELESQLGLRGRNRAAQQNSIEDAKLETQIQTALAVAQQAVNDAKANLGKGTTQDDVDRANALLQSVEDRSASLRGQEQTNDHLRLQLQDQNKEMSAFNQEVKRAADEVDRSLVTALQDAFNGKKVTDWAQVVRNSLAQIAAQLINIALIRPAIGSILSGLGLNQAAQSFAGGSGGAGGGDVGSTGIGQLSSFGSLASNVKSLFSGSSILSSSSLFGSPAGMTINPETGLAFNTSATSGTLGSGGNLFGVGPDAFGTANTFTTINPETGATFIGSAGGGSAPTGLTLGGAGTVAGGAFALGSGIADLVGGNKNTLGLVASGGEAVAGGVAVAAGLDSMFGAFGGALMGLGPYGLIAAAVLAVVSSLFGNKKPHNISGLDINSVGAGGDLSPLAVGNDNGANTDYLQGLLTNGAQPFLQQLSTAFGADLSGVNIGAFSHQTQGKDDLTLGFTGPVPGQSFSIDPNDKTGASIQDALTHLGLALLQTSSKVANADVSVARFNISLDDTASNIQRLLGFAVDFQSNIKSLNEGGGFDLSKTIAGTAQQQADSLQQQISQFMTTTRQLFPADAQGNNSSQLTQANDAIKNYLLTLVGLRDPVDSSLSTMEAAMKTLHANLDALKPLFDQFGISAKDAADALAAGIQKLKDQAADTIERADNTALGKDYLNQLKDLLTTEANNLRDVAALPGMDPASIYKLTQDQAGSILKGLTPDQLKEVANKYLGVAGATDIAAAALKLLGDAAKATAEQTKASIETFKTSLLDFANSLLVGNLSPLAPTDQLMVAQHQFYNDLAAGNNGDVAAQGRVQNEATTYLNLAQAQYASSQQYTDIFNQVEQALGQTKSVAQLQLEIQQNQLTAQQEMLDALKGIQHDLDPKAPANTNGGGGGITGLGTGAVSDLVRAELLGGRGPGGSFTNQDLANINNLASTAGIHPGTTQSQLELLGGSGPGGSFTQADLDRIAAAPHMASGGVPGGGIPGMDTNPVFTTPGEGVVSLQGMRTLGQINSGAFGANDAQVKALTIQVAQMTSVLQKILNVNVLSAEQLEEHLPAIAENTGNASAAAARRAA